MDQLSDDLVAWAWRKHARAAAHLEDLRTRIADDPDLLAGSPDAALVLGDALADLRAALDILVRAHADPSRSSAEQWRKLRFPIVVSEARWARDGVRRLRGVPEQVQDRIRSVQPFSRPEHERERTHLYLLRALELRELDGGALRVVPTEDLTGVEALVDTPAGPRPAVEVLAELVVGVAMVMTHVGQDTWRSVDAGTAGNGVVTRPEAAIA